MVFLMWSPLIVRTFIGLIESTCFYRVVLS